jgi:hypothetical protein
MARYIVEWERPPGDVIEVEVLNLFDVYEIEMRRGWTDCE